MRESDAVAGMLEGDYQAVLKALDAGRSRNEPHAQAQSDETRRGSRTPTIRDVVDLLEMNQPTAHRVGARTPEPPPLPETALRPMDFDISRLSRRPAGPPADQ